MKILTVVGARPNFMKAAPIIAAIKQHNKGLQAPPSGGHEPSRKTIQHVLVHTGQHYDDVMSDSFFRDLNLPEPDVHLGVGSGSHAAQTAEIMRKFEGVVLAERPEIVIVVGDVNSTMACALVTAKISFDSGGTRPLIAHVEAGLRSRDRSMPEEINRILTDHLADLLFVTESSGVDNLMREGIAPEKIHYVGNTMIDSLLSFREKADSSRILEALGLLSAVPENGSPSSPLPYALLTLHRPANVDDRETLQGIFEGLDELASQMPVIFPVHPRTRKRIDGFSLNLGKILHSNSAENPKIRLIEPCGYIDFICLMKNARLVLTDSGGIQEETTCLTVPCVTIRENTERPVTLIHGTNILAGTSAIGIRRAINHQLGKEFQRNWPEKWDGNTADRIVEILCRLREGETTSSKEPAAVST